MQKAEKILIINKKLWDVNRELEASTVLNTKFWIIFSILKNRQESGHLSKSNWNYQIFKGKLDSWYKWIGLLKHDKLL